MPKDKFWELTDHEKAIQYPAEFSFWCMRWLISCLWKVGPIPCKKHCKYWSISLGANRPKLKERMKKDLEHINF